MRMRRTTGALLVAVLSTLLDDLFADALVLPDGGHGRRCQRRWRLQAAPSVFSPLFEERMGFAAAEAQLQTIHGGKCSDAGLKERDSAFWLELRSRLDQEMGKQDDRALWRFEHFLTTHRLFSLATSGRTRTEGSTRLALGPTADLADGRRRVRPLCHYPRLESRAWWPQPGWLSHLEAKKDVVREELAAAMDKELWRGNDQSLFDSHGWSQVSLNTFGNDHAEAREHFPRTMALLREVGAPLGPGDCCIVRQAPKAGLPRHTDDRTHFLTAHLALESDGEACALTVDGESRAWSTSAEPTVVDTTYWHSTRNDNPGPVFLLLLDFWHPDISPVERRAFQIYSDLDKAYLAQTIGAGEEPSLRAAYEDFLDSKSPA